MTARTLLLSIPLLLAPLLAGGAFAAGGAGDVAIAACGTAPDAAGDPCNCMGRSQPDVENQYRNSCIGYTRTNGCLGWYDEHYDPWADTWEPSCTGYCPSNRVCVDREP